MSAQRIQFEQDEIDELNAIIEILTKQYINLDRKIGIAKDVGELTKKQATELNIDYYRLFKMSNHIKSLECRAKMHIFDIKIIQATEELEQYE